MFFLKIATICGQQQNVLLLEGISCVSVLGASGKQALGRSLCALIGAQLPAMFL
jgi:hypothetical protein